MVVNMNKKTGNELTTVYNSAKCVCVVWLGGNPRQQKWKYAWDRRRHILKQPVQAFFQVLEATQQQQQQQIWRQVKTTNSNNITIRRKFGIVAIINTMSIISDSICNSDVNLFHCSYSGNHRSCHPCPVTNKKKITIRNFEQTPTLTVDCVAVEILVQIVLRDTSLSITFVDFPWS